ncbi:hypothetical protein SFRURICE_019935 [Spodoptera frugiperda]|nr:hypothetical protein SFRURICE_019935 [Spodoptera frugiperda]
MWPIKPSLENLLAKAQDNFTYFFFMLLMLLSNDGVSCSFFSIRSYTLERAPSFTDRQTDGQFNLTFQKCLI